MSPESPFSPTYSRESYLETLGAGEALRRLDDGLGAREPFLVVTGEAGTGKTALVCEAVARWGPRVTAAFLAYPALTGTELLEEIIRRFGAEPPDGAGRSKLLSCLERALAEKTGNGQIAMLVVDDAHLLPSELLEELRLLVNAVQQARQRIEVVLVGLPALEARLDGPALAALRYRASVHARLEPLSAGETKRYLHHRVTAAGGDGPSTFSRKTCRDIAARTRGVPRQINALAAEALRVARAWGDRTVGIEHVQTAAASVAGLAPAGALDGDDGSDDTPATTATSRPPAPAKAPVVAPRAAPPDPASPGAPPRPKQAPVAAAAPPPKPPPPPAPPRATPAPAPVAKAQPAPPVAKPQAAPPPAAAMPDIAEPVIPIPTKHDPREWVSRFVGDNGPLQISAHAFEGPTWVEEPIESEAAEASGMPEGPAKSRDRRSHPRPRSRSKHRGGLRVAIPAGLALIVLAGGVAIVLRVGGAMRGRAQQAAAVVATALAPRDSNTALPAPARRKSARATAPSTTQAPAEPRRTAETTNSRGPFTLEVSGDLDFDTAFDERQRLQALTGFEGWVVPSPDDRDRYRVVVGVYRSQSRATSAANMLMNSRTLREVTVVSLPPRRVRQ